MPSAGKTINSTRVLRDGITFRKVKFDTSSIPDDAKRVYKHLENKYGEDYALQFIFALNTAIELHRAWHMTLLTAKILQQIKEKFGLFMTWDLGVIKLKIRVEDGGYELNRRVPYDYDSEYQDLYMRISTALIEGQINVHEALVFQAEVKSGVHTAKSGLFLRDFPGRLILYPLESATCAVIFFGGRWKDAGIAALTGLVAGIFEYALNVVGGEMKILTDIIVGFSTGLIAGLFYGYVEKNCLPAIFLGTLYWFFYGTAFVIGLLEIIAGQLETGVTRFMAVSIKTFVLSLGAGLGLMTAIPSSARDDWFKSQDEVCMTGDFIDKWWRIPLYLLCSASALGQYRTPIIYYWRGLAVQLAAYEVQYQSFKFHEKLHTRDNLDTSSSNILGAAAAVFAACFLSFFSRKVRYFYTLRLYQKDDSKNTKIGNLVFGTMKATIKMLTCLRLGRQSDFLKLSMASKLRSQRAELYNPTHERNEITLSDDEQNLILEAIVGAQDLNVWSILMPALYQLVPGSLIAKLWFNSIFPPQTINHKYINNLEGFAENSVDESVLGNLMVISTSLALGLIIGFACVQILTYIYLRIVDPKMTEANKLILERMKGNFCEPVTESDDPDKEFNEGLMKSMIVKPESGVALESDEYFLSNRDSHLRLNEETGESFRNE